VRSKDDEAYASKGNVSKRNVTRKLGDDEKTKHAPAQFEENIDSKRPR